MPIDSNQTTTTAENGESTPVFEVKFSNGAIKQLEELKSYFNKEDLLQVLKLGISLLQQIKDNEAKKTDSPSIN